MDLKATMTVEDALKRIRRTGPDKETINICYVIDEGRHLLGYLSIRTILLSEEDDVVGDIKMCIRDSSSSPSAAPHFRFTRSWPP